jgi:hypothetical protein
MLTLQQVIGTVEFSENEHSFIIPAFTLNSRLFEFLKEIRTVLASYALGEVTIFNEFGAEVSLTEQFNPNDEGSNSRLSITKNSISPVFFSIAAIVKMLKSENLLKPIYRLPLEAKGFTSDSVQFLGRFEIISQAQVITADPVTDDGNSKFIKSLNDESINFLPLKIDQWLSTTNTDLPAYWKQTAGAKLLACTGSELLLKNSLLEVTYRGDRRVSVSASLQNADLLNEIFDTVNKVCLWIYTEGKDIETRHNLFNNQVCNLSVYDVDHFIENFKKIAERVLENSVLAYRYYLLDSNKELNKSLIEINKTLFEHINKIRQNTTDLVNSLWRDFTTAFGLLILNFSLKKPDISGHYWNLLLIGLISYLLISYYLSSSVGFWFYRRLKGSLADIRVRIYGYLTESDFNEFAISPLKSAQGKFVRTFWIILLCYLAIIILVLCSMGNPKNSHSSTIFSFI